MFMTGDTAAPRAVPATRMPASLGLLPLADVADGERRDGWPERVIRRKDAVISVPVLARRRHKVGEPVEKLKRRELDPNHDEPSIASPFANHHFEHPDTRWYNIGCSTGAARHFGKNADAIINFIAIKVARNIAENKRTLLVARKKFAALCQRLMTERLVELGLPDVSVVIENWGAADLDNPHVVPLIHYGVSGINLFEHHDAAYCLSSYYVSATTVAKTAMEIEPSAHHHPVRIEAVGHPPRRRAILGTLELQNTIIPTIVEGVFVQKEADVVVQAVGRVRPFTRPREIITFQMGDLPGVRYEAEFSTLAAARQHFDVPTRREREAQQRAARALQMAAEGMSTAEIAHELKVGVRTVQRYLKADDATRHLINNIGRSRDAS
jgi:hypothetical protein